MRLRHRFTILALFIALLSATSAFAAIGGLQRVASGLSAPVYITHAPGDQSRLFVVELGGAIKIIDLANNGVVSTPFLTIPDVDQAGEGGLLGMAFHPDYATNGKFYVNVTVDNGGAVFEGATSPFSTRIRQYKVSSNPNVANPTPTEILSFLQPQENHNGGWLDFSPNDHYLYIATGDGGSGNDVGSGHVSGGNAQATSNNLLGKMLRIDVNGDDFPGTTPENLARNYAIPPTNPFVGGTGDGEIWAYGLRNPFRAGFDRTTGDLWIGDVGQSAREEIDFQPANSTGGENYGWRLREGKIATPSSGIGGPPPPGNVEPVYDYQRPLSNPANDPAITQMNQYRGTTVIGGYVYRGPDNSQQGKYFFLDRSAGDAGSNYWTFDPANPVGTVQNIDSLMLPNTGIASGPTSFGEDAAGNLYIAFISSGEVYRINMAHPGGDYDLDGHIDNDDYAVWQRSFGRTTPGLPADGNNNSAIDAADYVVWRNALSGGSGGSIDAAVPETTAALLFAQFAAIMGSLAGPRRRN